MNNVVIVTFSLRKNCANLATEQQNNRIRKQSSPCVNHCIEHYIIYKNKTMSTYTPYEYLFHPKQVLNSVAPISCLPQI